MKSELSALSSLLFIPLFFCFSCRNSTASADSVSNPLPDVEDSVLAEQKPELIIDTAQFDKLNQYIANGDTTGLWPPEIPVPLPGAIFPFHRIVAFYGNLYSKNMGILGELPKSAMLKKLLGEVESWQKADTMLKVIPALHYIAVTAQAAPGTAGKYRLRMPFHQIDTILNWSKEIDALTFLDVQVGHSTLQEEIPALDEYLKLPTVHLGIDPEFSMKSGHAPGKRIGTYDAVDINWVIDHLAKIVRENNLPPKVLVIHRFTRPMVTNYKNIKKVPEVQVVMDMDGWGPRHLKISSWKSYIYREPVEYAGFKIFYKNDTKTGAAQLFYPEDLVKFVPNPVYIQYQ